MNIFEEFNNSEEQLSLFNDSYGKTSDGHQFVEILFEKDPAPMRPIMFNSLTCCSIKERKKEWDEYNQAYINWLWRHPEYLEKILVYKKEE